MADTATPPLPPDVTGQQQSAPLGDYADGAQQQQAPQGGVAQSAMSSAQMLEMLYNEIAEKLDKAAQVANVSDPAQMEYIKKMAQVGSAAIKDIQMSKQKQSQGPGPKAGLEQARTPPEGQARAIAA